MTMQLTIAIAGLLGLIIGLAIGRNARKERDDRIKELEGELAVKQNVCEAQNERICVQRREIERLHNNHKPFKL